MILLGYTLCILYIGVLIALTKLTFTLTKNTEFGRKLLHAGAFGILFIAKAFFVSFFHFTILCAVAAVFTFVAYKFRLIKSIERKHRTAGEFFYCLSLLACSIALCFFPELFPSLVAAFAALSIGDGAASLFGKLIRSPKIHFEKTLVGTIACILFTFLSLFLLKLVNYIELSYLTIVTLSLASGIFELVGKGLDNFTVPLSVFVLCALFTKFGQSLEIAVLIGEGVFLVAFLSKFITYYGSLLAGLIGLLFYYFGGIFPILYLIACYGVMLSTSLLKKLKKVEEVKTIEKTKGKDFIEIFVNGFFSTLAIVLYGVLETPTLLLVSLITISSSFVDSLSSDVGALSKKAPRDIVTRKPVEKGISGGVSLLGTLAALLGSFGFGTAITLFVLPSPLYIPLVSLTIFLGTLVDSILGSLLQAKYRCPVCGLQTEKRTCCEQVTLFEKGVPFINNDIINLLSSLAPFGVAFLFFLI